MPNWEFSGNSSPGLTLPAKRNLPRARVRSRCWDEGCSGDVACVVTEHATEVFIRCAPPQEFATKADVPALASRYYACLARLLRQWGGDVSQVIHERAFLGDIDRDAEEFIVNRKSLLEHAGVATEGMPALTCLGQPPCKGSWGIEIQAYAVVPRTGSFSIETTSVGDKGTTAKLYDIGGRRHLYVSGIRGLAADPGRLGAFREQSDRMFAYGALLLERHGARFTDVLRTWCYLGDIDRDYAAFNASRNGFFRTQGVTRLPASTGIEARLRPEGTLCAMDLYALLDTKGVDIDTMRAQTLNEAGEYGSFFSRGMKIGFPGEKVLYVSGTASIDEAGETVHQGDIRGQLERMLLNVEELLASEGATLEDVVQSVAFLKRAEDSPVFATLMEERGMRSLPNTVVEADICRSELLCEIEAVAVLAGKGRGGLVDEEA
jgi:enamine deaminase RidA (YjgF/YER057c/UK114 family)